VLGFRRRGTAPVRVRYLRRAPLSGDDSYERKYLASRGYQHYASTPQAVPPAMDPIAVASLPARSGPPPLPDRAPRATAIAALPVPALVPAQTPQPETVATVGAWRTELRGSPEETGSIVPMRQAGANSMGPPGGPSIQAGSFRNRDNAEHARVVLSPIAPVDVAEVDVGGETFFRVRVGPFADAIEAVAALPLVTDAGYQGAKIIKQN